MGDRNYEMYVERMHARAEGLAEGKKEGKIEMVRQATFSQSNQQQTFSSTNYIYAIFFSARLDSLPKILTTTKITA